MRPEEYYIVRIYRRDEQDPRNVVGFVESVRAERKKTFNSPEDLWRIMNVARKGGRNPKSGKGCRKRG